MYTLYYAKTPNGQKPLILLELLKASYTVRFINIEIGDQFDPNYLKISPNNKIPCLVDHTVRVTDASGNQTDLAIFESAAIMIYLASKHKAETLLPSESNVKERYNVLQWLIWQNASMGPMLGQNHHFTRYAPEKIPYAISRYQVEAERLYKVLNTQLALQKDRFVCGESLTLADIAIYPWCAIAFWHNIDLENYPHVQKWCERMSEIPEVKKSMKLKTPKDDRKITEEDRRRLFGIKPEALSQSSTTSTTTGLSKL